MFDPQDDFPDVFDGAEPVALCRLGEQPRPVAHALRLSARRDRRGAPAAPGVLEAVWHLPAAALAYPPRPGDAIVDAAGAAWTIVEATPVACGTRWRCTVQRFVAQGPDQLVDIEKAEYEIGPSGAETVRWNTWKTAVPAVVHSAASVDIATLVDGSAQAAATRPSWRAVLAEPLPDEGDYRVRAADGALYRIVAWRPLALGAAAAGVELDLVAWQ